MIRTLSLIFCAAFLLSCAPQTDFSLHLILTEDEQSDDSNSVTHDITVTGQKVRYHWVYDGYHPNKNFDTDKTYVFTLDDNEFEALLAIITEYNLAQNVTENQPLPDMGRSVEAVFDLKQEGVVTHSTLMGTLDSWGDGTVGDNLEYDEYYAGLQSIVTFVENTWYQE